MKRTLIDTVRGIDIYAESQGVGHRTIYSLVDSDPDVLFRIVCAGREVRADYTGPILNLNPTQLRNLISEAEATRDTVARVQEAIEDHERNINKEWQQA